MTHRLIRFLSLSSLLLLLTLQAQAQSTIEGTVEDDDGTTIPGASVLISELDLGAATDMDGDYAITDVPAGTYEIEASYIGLRTETREVTVSDGETLTVDFTLREAALDLDEVVVTGAGGPSERRQLGNTVGTIDSEGIETAPVSDFSDVLQGREPGLLGLSSSGSTGEGARIRIRGSASLSQSNEPIVFVDGVRVDRGGGFGGFVSAGGAGSPSRLDDINPRSIERVEVLKGAAAATLYGTQASNGVIQVFTRNGLVSEPQFEVVARQGATSYPRVIPDNTGYARTQAQADSMSHYYGGSLQPYELVRQNYVHDLFATGHTQEYSASASGGTEGITYYLNGRWTREDGPIDGSGIPFADGHQALAQDVLERLQGTAQINIFPAERLQFNLSTGFNDTGFETFQTGNNNFGIVSGAMHGKPELVGHQNLSGGSYTATLQERLQQTVHQDVRSFNTSLGFNYRPLANLILDGTVGLDYTGQSSQSIRPYGWDIDRYTGMEVEGSRRTSDRSFVSNTLDLKATLNQELSPRLSATFITGAQRFSTQTALRSGLGRDFPGPGLSVSGAASEQEITESLIEESEMGVFAQGQLGLDDYLFLTLGGRYDAHSAFGSDFSGVFYPKVSTSVVLSDAPFWQDVGPVSLLRLRGSLGQSGLQPGAFDALTTYSSLNSAEGPGIVPENLGNPDLSPEIATEWEVGFELGLWDNRVAVETTYWDRTVRDALVSRQFPVTGGFLQQQRDNIGELTARGVELSVSGQAIDGRNLSVDVHANASYLWEQITSLGGAPPIKVGGSYPRYRQFLKEGFAPGAHFGAKLLEVSEGHLPVSQSGLLEALGRDASGIDPNDPASQELVLEYLSTLDPETASLEELSGYVLLADEAGNGDPLDHYLGKPTPDWQGSFGVDVGFLQNFRLSTLFEYRFGDFFINDLTGGFRQRSSGIGRNTPATSRVERDYLTGGVDENYEPQNDPEVRLEAAEEWIGEHLALDPFSGLNSIHPGDFIRLREVSLTYSLPASLVESLRLRRFSLTVSGRNLWLGTRYPGVDPEINAIGRGGSSDEVEENFLLGTDAWNLPLPRELNVMLQIGF